MNRKVKEFNKFSIVMKENTVPLYYKSMTIEDFGHDNYNFQALFKRIRS